MKERGHTKEKLVQIFRDAASRHFEASLNGDYKKANREAKTIRKTFHLLREMGEEGYQALMILLENEYGAVATAAAAYLLRYATDAATRVLQRHAQDKGLIGFESQQALERWREGDWHLDE